MTRLAALHARITGDSSGFVTAAQQAENAAQDAAAAMGPTSGPGGLAGATNKTTGALKKLSSSPGMRMLPIQLSQVAQQAAAGGGVMRALTIQAADIGMAFGVAGTIIGTLATVAMPTIIGMFSDGADEAEGFADSIDAINDLGNELDETLGILSMGVDELGEKFGANGALVRGFAIDLANLQLQQARARVNEFALSIDEVGDAIINTARQTGQGRRAIAQLADSLGISTDGVQQLAAAFDNLQQAEGIDAQIAASQELTSVMDELGIEAIDVGEGVVEIQSALLEAGIAGAELERVMALVRDRAAEAADASRNILGVTRGDPGTLAGYSGAELLPPDPEADPTKPGRRGGGGSRAREADKFEADVERLREQLLTEIEVERELNEMRQEMLIEAKERELLTEQEFNELMEREKERHNEAMTELDVYRYGTSTEQMQKFMGDMAGALAKGNDKMMKIGKAFGAAEALINSWRAFAQVMADDSLPWYAKLPAALSVFASAVQAVDAIKGVSEGGGGRKSAGGGGGGGDGGGGGGEQAAPRRQVNLTLIGNEGFSRAQIVQVMNEINDSSDDGANTINIRGRR